MKETADSSDVLSIPDELELEVKPDDLVEKEDDANSTADSVTEVNNFLPSGVLKTSFVLLLDECTNLYWVDAAITSELSNTPCRKR